MEIVDAVGFEPTFYYTILMGVCYVPHRTNWIATPKESLRASILKLFSGPSRA